MVQSPFTDIHAEKLTNLFVFIDNGWPCEFICGSMPQRQRLAIVQAMYKFEIRVQFHAHP
jgi:hypothetical protein